MRGNGNDTTSPFGLTLIDNSCYISIDCIELYLQNIGGIFLQVCIFIVCRRFEPSFQRQPLPLYGHPLFIFLLNPPPLAQVFWQYHPMEIPDKYNK